MNPLARIAYNMIAEGAEAGVKASGDDMLRAAERIAEDVVKAGDDWGWKGGKPGEVTGLDFRRQIRNADFEGNERKLKSIYEKVRRQVFGKGKGTDSAVFSAMNQFAEMERAGIPREYTGKIYKSAGELITHPNVGAWLSHPTIIRGYSTDNITDLLSQQLQPLTRAQRITAINILPSWTRSLDDLGAGARSLEGMTNDQRETFLALLPEWDGSLDDLAFAAKELS